GPDQVHLHPRHPRPPHLLGSCPLAPAGGLAANDRRRFCRPYASGMIPSRLIKTLLVLPRTLALVIVVRLLLQRHHPQPPFSRAVDATGKITLQTGSASIELDHDSAVWTVTSRADKGPYKADPDKVKALQTSLRNLLVEDEISDRPD